MKTISKDKYKVGNRVKFQPYSNKYPKTCLGIIIKMNPKRAKIKVYVGDSLGIWMVPYLHLDHITTKHEITLLTIGKMQNP